MTAKEMLTRYYELEERIHGIDIMLDDYRNKYQVSGTGLGVQGGSKVSFIEADADKRQALIKERDGYKEEADGIWQEIQPRLIKLSPAESLIISLRYYCRNSYEEITRKLYGAREDYLDNRDVYTNAMYATQHRAVKKLNALINGK